MRIHRAGMTRHERNSTLIRLQLPFVATLLTVNHRHHKQCRKTQPDEQSYFYPLQSAYHKVHVLVRCLEIQLHCPQVSTVVSSGNPCRPDITTDNEAVQPQSRGCDVTDTPSSSSHRNGTTCCCVQLDFQARAVAAPSLLFRSDFNFLASAKPRRGSTTLKPNRSQRLLP